MATVAMDRLGRGGVEDAYALAHAASQLEQAAKSGGKALTEALEHNLQVWVAIRTIVSRPDCPLPKETRNNLIRLSRYVAQKTFEVSKGINAGLLHSLIDVDLKISEGLLQGLQNKAKKKASGAAKTKKKAAPKAKPKKAAASKKKASTKKASAKKASPKAKSAAKSKSNTGRNSKKVVKKMATKAKKTTAKKAPAKKAAAKKPAAKKAAVKKAPAKKAAVKKAPAKKAAVKKAPAKKKVAKKAAKKK